jgi:hypothetical protein
MLPLEIKMILKTRYMKRTLMTKAFKHPSILLPHERKGLICYSPFQDLEFHETSFSYLEEENLMEEPSFDEENDDKEIENIDALLHIER